MRWYDDVYPLSVLHEIWFSIISIRTKNLSYHRSPMPSIKIMKILFPNKTILNMNTQKL